MVKKMITKLHQLNRRAFSTTLSKQFTRTASASANVQRSQPDIIDPALLAQHYAQQRDQPIPYTLIKPKFQSDENFQPTPYSEFTIDCEDFEKNT